MSKNRTHVVIRTSPKGGPFIGRCKFCGTQGLGLGGAQQECPAPDSIRKSEAEEISDLIEEEK